MAKRDYYEILGISKSASDQEIKRAYRKLAKKYHPDVNKDADAEAKFKEVNEAYEVLSDSQKKATYDQFGHAGMDGANFSGAGGFGGFGGFEDIFSAFSGFGGFGGFGGQSQRSYGPRKGDDVYRSMKIDFMAAVFGTTKSIKLEVDKQCTSCGGSGAFSKGDIETCSTCHGRGRVRVQRRSIIGVIETEDVCPECHGRGKKIRRYCKECGGKGYQHKNVEVDINIPQGINSGQQIRVPSYGGVGDNGGPNGDLYIEIIVAAHEHFRRHGNDIYLKVPISAVDATLGTMIDVPTINGDVELNIPAGTQPNTRLRLKGQGVKDLRSGIVGDQYIEVDVKIPTKLSKDERNLYTEIQASANKKESIFDKFKNAFK